MFVFRNFMQDPLWGFAQKFCQRWVLEHLDSIKFSRRYWSGYEVFFGFINTDKSGNLWCFGSNNIRHVQRSRCCTLISSSSFGEISACHPFTAEAVHFLCQIQCQESVAPSLCQEQLEQGRGPNAE